MSDAVRVLRGLEELFPENLFIEHLRGAIEKHPDCNWDDAMSRGQINSKQWVVHELTRLKLTNLGLVCLVGGWLGILPRLIIDSEITVEQIVSIDLDLDANVAALELNYRYPDQFCAFVQDAYVSNYEGFNTVINTSCEHFARFGAWWDRIQPGTLVILQSNNYFGPEEHVNIVKSEDELAEQAPMSATLFKGRKKTHLYDRFMVIGVK